ncbi:MAG: hypothetical protein K8T26_17805 [Lentisphaerae bacterium]|nr:hypothetical protein [Lentisphaerota bacterium]
MSVKNPSIAITPGARPEITDRYYRVYTYQSVDRVPDLEFGYWPQTIRRWLKEGLPLELTREETNDMFCPKVDAYFGFEYDRYPLPLKIGMNPAFEEVVLEKKANSEVVRGTDGIVAERYKNDSDDSSIPHYLEFPVKTPEDWTEVKTRYQLDDPSRVVPASELEGARRAMAEGHSIRVFFVGFYGQLRNWLGMENLSYAFYDYPDMIHDMMDLWAELAARQIEQLPPDIRIDKIDWWEDMASRNGPLVSPAQFREFIQPAYRRVMQAARKRGCVVCLVDSDGDPHDIVANFLEEGVNVMFPLEVTAGVDPYAWRKEFGLEMRLQGGIAKTPLVEGGAAIDRELERIRPLLEQGGYIPHLDHLVPPDISFDHYRQYLDKKRRLIGK